MALTMWTNVMSGKRLNSEELAAFRAQAHRVYEANSAIFEDEREALAALGVMSMREAMTEVFTRTPPLRCASAA